MRARKRTIDTKTGESVLDELISASDAGAPAVPASGVLVGECVDARHATLRGRALIAWCDAAGRTERRWLPTLEGVVLRVKDRVLVVQPENFDELVVTGVLDGFTPRPERELHPGPSIRVETDEVVSVSSADGQKFLEIRQEQAGPVVRIVTQDVDLELPGALRLSADQIQLKARRGSVAIDASDDVIVRGEVIKLN